MKQLLPLLFLLIALSRVEAQSGIKKSRFAFVAIDYDARNEMYDARIDSGQAPIWTSNKICVCGRGIELFGERWLEIG
jgi:hypothetical protein